MLIIPAIDIRAGRVVRLLQGDFSKETFYSGNPSRMAMDLEKKGAKMLHVVDLDGALSGEPKNIAAISEIAKSVGIPIELGGGLRTEEAVEKVFSYGISRAVIGTRACEENDFIKRLVKKHGSKIAVGIDAADGDIVTDGWTNKTLIKARDFAIRMETAGVKTIIFTNVLKDGTLENVELEPVREIADSIKADVIVSGGVSSLDDVKSIKSLGKNNITGIIIGKAIYEGKIDIQQANMMAEQ